MRDPKAAESQETKPNSGRSSTAILFLLAAATLATGTQAFAQGSSGHGTGRPAVPPTSGGLRPHAWFGGSPFVSPSLAGGLSPSQVSNAYGIGLAGGYGQGATVAIVDAYDSPNAASDLDTFSSTFGIRCPTAGLGTLTKVNQNGDSAPLPVRNTGWEIEINLDTQWVHAMAPCANIVLVEANSSSLFDMLAAVSAAKRAGSIVSMSWGTSESALLPLLDSTFTGDGVTFLASSGDIGGGVMWPSSSRNVIGVGGTVLALDADDSVLSETAWNGSGGGCSAVEGPLRVQQGFIPSSCKKRAVPDVSIDGGSAVAVYISLQSGWFPVWGTSLSAQLWAGLVAIANGERTSPLTQTLNDLYPDASGDPASLAPTGNFRDIVTGIAGGFSAGVGWDFITGWGSPLANSLVPGYLTKQP